MKKANVKETGEETDHYALPWFETMPGSTPPALRESLLSEKTSVSAITAGSEEAGNREGLKQPNVAVVGLASSGSKEIFAEN